MPIKPFRARVAAVVASLVLAVAVTIAPADAADRSPAGTPDVSAMVLQPADMPAGSTVLDEGPGDFSGASTAYERAFSTPQRSGFVVVDSLVALEDSPATSSRTYTSMLHELRSRAGRRQLGRMIANAVGVRASRVHVGRLRELAIGDGAFAVSARVKLRSGHVTEVLSLAHVDRALAQVVVAGPSAAKPMRLAGGYLAVVADHIHAGLSPVATNPPTIADTAVRGETLHATPGAWAPATAPTSLAYQWQRCDAAGNACAPIPGAVQPTYVVSAADAGATLRIVVTARNSAGESSASSAPTAVVP